MSGMSRERLVPEAHDRKKQIDDAIEKAETGGKPKQKAAPKNPYPEGSARAKLWARREAENK